MRFIDIKQTHIKGILTDIVFYAYKHRKENSNEIVHETPFREQTATSVKSFKGLNKNLR